MGFPRSIRWRLQLWYGALLVAVLCGFGFSAFHLENARRFRRIDAGLHERISTLVDALRGAPGREAPKRDAGKEPATTLQLSPQQSALFTSESGYYFVIWKRGREPLQNSPNAPAAVPQPKKEDAVVRMRGDLREAFLFAAPVDCVLVGRSIDAEQAELRRLASLLAVIGAAVLAAGLVIGGWLVTRALRPVADISVAAAKIAAGDLSQRIDATDAESELGQLATLLNSTFARLETAFAQQARFTADAAHELRTPVSVILTQTQSTLVRERSAAEYKETVEACQRAAQRMRRLTDALLALARLDAEQESLRSDECDLAQITGDCIELIRPLAAARGIDIQAELATAGCRGDAQRLAQVVTNLLSNAITYNDDGGKVRVTTGAENGTATLTVNNTGPGIPAEDLPQIFERFHRADKARTAGHSGLGLAITRAIIQAHGGSIEATSDAASGTTFTVRLNAKGRS